MLKVERKCANKKPVDDGTIGASAWKVSPLLAGDKVVITSRITTGNVDTRTYLRVDKDGAMRYVSKRDDATVFSILSQTGERDPLRERNEIQLYAETNHSNTPHGFVYLERDEKQLKVFNDAPDRTIASRIRLVPSLLTEKRIERGFRKSEPASPFIFTPDANLDRFAQDEGALVRYGDIFILRAPTLEFGDNYQYVACADANKNCSIVQANVDKVDTPDMAQFFSFQCPRGGVLYARTVPASVLATPSHQPGVNPFISTQYDTALVKNNNSNGITNENGTNESDSETLKTDTVVVVPPTLFDTVQESDLTQAELKEKDAEDDDREIDFVEQPSIAVIAAVQEKENDATATDRPTSEGNTEQEQQPWYEKPLGMAGIALLALSIIALLVWSIVKVTETRATSSINNSRNKPASVIYPQNSEMVLNFNTE